MFTLFTFIQFWICHLSLWVLKQFNISMQNNLFQGIFGPSVSKWCHRWFYVRSLHGQNDFEQSTNSNVGSVTLCYLCCKVNVKNDIHVVIFIDHSEGGILRMSSYLEYNFSTTNIFCDVPCRRGEQSYPPWYRWFQRNFSSKVFKYFEFCTNLKDTAGYSLWL